MDFQKRSRFSSHGKRRTDVSPWRQKPRHRKCHHLTHGLPARHPFESRTTESFGLEMGAHTLDCDTCPSNELSSGFSRFSLSARPGRVLSTQPSMTLMVTPQLGAHPSTDPTALGMVRTALAVSLIRTGPWPLTKHGRLHITIRA
jgi:hypothetical protein